MADDALRTVIAAGRFAPERAESFSVVYHFESVAAWLDYISGHWTSATLDPELVARAHEALPTSTEGEVRILRAIHAARLRRT
jgi:hypothetical protein